MRLFVIRHAPALEHLASGSDEARPLTSEGQASFRGVVRQLARRSVQLDLVVHSPLLRAIQTAELLQPLVRGTTRVSAELAKAPGAELLAELEGETVAVVGHEPFVGELVAWLVTGERALGARFPFRKSGVAELEGRALPGEMSLLSFLPPDALNT